MNGRLRHLRRDERGMSFIFIGASFMALIGATTLAIDVGMFMTARSQAQNSADAGALAGATALVFQDWNDRTPSGPAVQNAIGTGQSNVVIGQTPSITPDDVTFPNDAHGQPTRVQVQVFRNAARGNPVPTLLGSLLGVNTVDIAASATAEASPANAEMCVKPFTIPDKWQENTDPPWTPDSTFDAYDNKGNALPNPDVYVGSGAGYTGYNANRDKGIELVIKADNGNKVAPSTYDPWDLPGSSGGDDYKNNIVTCNTNIIPIGQIMPSEPGNMVGPTAEGVQDLIDRDPDATWDTTCNCVKSTYPGVSPRIGIIPVYDPMAFETGKQNGSNATLIVTNYIGIFIVGMQGQDVVARITPILGIVDPNSAPAPDTAFPRAIRLVQ